MLLETANLLWPSFFVAAALSLGLHLVCSRMFVERPALDPLDEFQPGGFARRAARSYVLSIAVSAAVFVGVARLRGEVSLPKLYWEWLPYLGLGSCLVASPLAVVAASWRAVFWLPIGLIAAWFLVPTWESLRPSQTVYLLILGFYLVALIWLYASIASSIPVRQNIVAMTMTAVAISVVIAAVVSLKYSQLALIVATSLAGLLACFFVKLNDASHAGLMPCAAVLLGGAAFVGYIYPDPPIYELALLPLAPTVMLISPRESRKSLLTRFASLVVLLSMIVVIVLLRYD